MLSLNASDCIRKFSNKVKFGDGIKIVQEKSDIVGKIYRYSKDKQRTIQVDCSILVDEVDLEDGWNYEKVLSNIKKSIGSKLILLGD